jgi:tyrosyl-tRNA synthetase
MIHGDEATEDALKASRILFGGDLDGVTEKTFGDVVGEIPTVELERARLEGEGMGLLELLSTSGLCKSNGEARRDVQGNGISVNNVKTGDIERVISTGDLLFDKHLLLRKGKKNYVVVSVK